MSDHQVSMKGRRTAGFVIAAFVLGTLVVVWIAKRPSNPVRALPGNATQIHEWHWSSGFLPDYIYCLKARVSEDGFQTFISAMDLKEPYSAERHRTVSWGVCDQPWWDPLPSSQGAFVSYAPQDDTLEAAKWESGYLYYLAVNW